MRSNIRLLICSALTCAATSLTACDSPARSVAPEGASQTAAQATGKDLAVSMVGELRTYPAHVIAQFKTDLALGLPDGVRPVSYSWTFDDGSREFGEKPSHTFADTGTHAVFVSVRDQDGRVHQFTQTVKVSAGIAALGTVLTGIVPGGLHTCAINSVATLYCWGYNGHFNVGDNTSVDRLSPVAVSSGVGFVEVATGWSHSCALTATGSGYCWGRNGDGELGDGTVSDQPVPSLVPGALVLSSISVGWRHTCALTADSLAYCWGDNSYGQLGNGGTGQRQTSPVAVAGNRKYTMLRAGYDNTCGITSAGAAYCWGANYFGQVGNGTGGLATDFVSSPALVSGGLNFSSIGLGAGHVCGITSVGNSSNTTIYCWGWNTFGQLGFSSSATCVSSLACSKTPGKVTTIKKPISLAIGETHNCGIDQSGILECWGYNGAGQIGDGTRTTRTSSVVVATPVAMKSIHAGGAFTCGVGIDNVAYCWGSNISGKLGLGDTVDRLTPVAVPGLTF